MSSLISQYLGTQWIALDRIPPGKEGSIDFKEVAARGTICLVLRDGNILMSRITRPVWSFRGTHYVEVEDVAGGVLIEQVYVCTDRVGAETDSKDPPK